MSRNTKIVLGVVAGFLMLCACVSVAGIALLAATGNRMYRGVPERAVQVQQAFSDPVFAERAPVQYDLPAGWRQDFTLHIFGFDMTGLGGSDGHSHIFLVQLPPERDVQTSLREALAHVGNDRTGYRNGIEFRNVGQAVVTLRGQPVTMMVSEGTNHDGEAYRQMTGVAADGTAQLAVVIEQPVKSWDQAMVDRFIASIR